MLLNLKGLMVNVGAVYCESSTRLGDLLLKLVSHVFWGSGFGGRLKWRGGILWVGYKKFKLTLAYPTLP